MFFQGEDLPGQGNVPAKIHRRVNEVQCTEDVTSLTDELWQYALDNFSTACVSLVTKQSAIDFYQSLSSQINLSFHLQSVQAPSVSWERSDPRVSKEILKCKVLTSPASQCFSIQSTKIEEDESKRLIIDFSHVVGLKINEDSIEMDVSSTPKVEKKVNAKPAVDKTARGKWLEQSLQVINKPPHRVKLLFAIGRGPGTAKLQDTLNEIPSLKRAIAGGLANVYVLHDRQLNENPEERYPIVQDPTLVRAAQLACLRILQTVPSANKAEYATKIYAGMEGRFNQLLRERNP